jgi:hypothetical protein
MKKLFGLVAVMLMACVPAMAQTHTISLSWVASTTAGVATYNVYRAPCTGTISAGVCSAEGTFAKIGNVAAPIVTYSDSTVAAGSSYSYYVTAVCPVNNCSGGGTGESVASNHIAAAVPFPPPNPPSNLSITSVSKQVTGSTTTLSASWVDTPGTTTNYSILWQPNGQVITSGWVNSATGIYTTTWTGKVKPNTQVIFKVCDATKTCDSRTI